MQTLIPSVRSPKWRWAATLLVGCSAASLVGCGAAERDGLFAPPADDSAAPSTPLVTVAPARPESHASASGAAPTAAPSSPATNGSAPTPSPSSNGTPSSGTPSSGTPSAAPPSAAPPSNGPANNGAPARDAPAPAANPSAPAPAANSVVIRIERAEWDSDKAALEVRGSASSAEVTLTVSFGGRTEPLQNDRGEFRGEFADVSTDPGHVVVSASDGSSADAPVERK